MEVLAQSALLCQGGMANGRRQVGRKLLQATLGNEEAEMLKAYEREGTHAPK